MDLNTFRALTLAPKPVVIDDVTFYVRCMTVSDQIAYGETLKTVTDHRWVFVLLRFSLCDEKGNLLFSGTTPEEIAADVEIISQKPRVWISPLFDAAREINKMNVVEEKKEDEPSPQ